MAAVDISQVYSGTMTVLAANAAVQTALGNPARIYIRVPPQASFPYAKMDAVPTPRYSGGLGGRWIRAVGIQFNIFDNDTSVVRVAAAMKAIMDVMDQLPGSFNVSGIKLGSCVPEIDGALYEGENGAAAAVCSWRLSVEAT